VNLNKGDRAMTLLWKRDDATVWLNPIDAAIIAKLPSAIDFQTRTFVEVGVYRAGLVRTFLQNNPMWDCLGIDPYPELETERVRAKEIIKACNLQDRFELCDSWKQLFGRTNETNASIIHIDGEHSETAACFDLDMTLKVTNAKSIIIVDDFMARIFPGVTSAVFNFLSKVDYAVLLISPAKIYLCKSELHTEYQNKLRELLRSLDLIYLTGFPKGKYGLMYEQPSSINGKNILIVENQELTEIFRKTLGINSAEYSLRKLILRILRWLLPPFLYALLRKVFK
jgi:hypothetical protein